MQHKVCLCFLLVREFFCHCMISSYKLNIVMRFAFVHPLHATDVSEYDLNQMRPSQMD